MSQLDPIELEILLNSTAVAQQSNNLRASLRGVDSSILATENKFRELNQSQLQAVNGNNLLGNSFKSLSSAAVAYFSFNTASNFVSSLVQVRGEYQKTEIAFKTMLGSKEEADSLMKEAVDLASKTPFDMKQVTDGAKQLLAFNVPANEVIDTLRRMGDISAGLNVPLSQLQLAFGQVKAKGKLMGDDLRQFTEAGVPMVEELAKKFGVTSAEIYQMVSAGKIGFNDVKGVLFSLTNEGGKFFNLMEEQSKSLAGEWANLEDAIEQVFNKMGQSSEGILSSGISSLTYLVEHYSELLDILGGIITTYGSYKGAVMLISAMESARNKVLKEEIANLAISDKMKLGRALVTQRQAQASLEEARAEQSATQAKYQSLQAEVALLNIKKQKAVALAVEKAQILENARNQLTLAQAELSALGTTATARQTAMATKNIEKAQNQVLAAQETAEIARKNALAVSQEFYSAKTNLNTTAKTLSATASKLSNAQEALSVATKNASAVAESRLTLAQTLRASATQLVAKAQALLNATMLTNPIVLMIAVVGGLSYAYLKMRDTTNAAQLAEKKLQEQREQSKKATEELKSKTQELMSVLQDENATRLAQSEAFAKLQKLYPALLRNMDLDTFKKKGLANTQKELNAEMDKFSTKKLVESLSKAQQEMNRLRENHQKLEQTIGEGLGIDLFNLLGGSDERLKAQEKIIADLKKQLEERNQQEKLANMTIAERQIYWQNEVKKIEEAIRAQKNSNTKKTTANTILKSMLGNANLVGNAFASWDISRLQSQLMYAQSQVDSINRSMGGVSTDKNKAYWETQMKEAKEANDAMTKEQIGSKSWNENVKKYQEAEAELKKYNYSAKEAISTQNKLAKRAEKAAETLAKKQKDFIKELDEAERELSINRLQNNDREIASTEEKYKKLKDKAKELKLSPQQVGRIDKMQEIELGVVRYKQDTEKLLKDLEEEKEIYSAYEAFKTKVSQEEAEKRFEVSKWEFKNFSERLQAEIDKLNELKELTPEQKERKEKLTQKQKDYNKDEAEKDREKYADAYNALLSFDDKRRAVEKKYQEDKKQLETINDPIIRQGKLQELEYQKKMALDAINAEAYERSVLYEKMSENLLGITRRELQNRIEALEEYLQASKDVLSQEQRAFVRKELEKAKAVRASTSIGVEEKILLREKEEILKRITDKQQKGIGNVSEELKELEEVNGKLKDILAKKFAKVSEVAGQLGSAFSDLGSSLKEYDEELGDVVETMGELLNVASEVSGAVASFASGDVVGGIVKTIKSIGSLFKIGAKARESERKAQEQIKKYHDEIFQSQLNYNAELRKRVAEEIKLNDLYKSRVGNIKEELEAHRKNKEAVIKDQQEVFKRLIKAQTVVGMRTERYGGFLGIGRKTRAVEIKKSVAELLGIGEMVEKRIRLGFFKMNIKVFQPKDIELTDEIFDRLERLNAERPLTGDAKTAYDQLKKLRDEYGSIEQAQRELQKQLKDALTGTTADSLAESIKQGIASGKRAFADFADDIEGVLRNAVLAGLETDAFREKTQKLQDALAEMMQDGVISSEERQKFNELYMAIVEETKQKMELINQAGLKVIHEQENANSLQGSIKSITQEGADILAGHLAGLRLYVKDIYEVVKNSGSGASERLSRMIEIQMNIEKNTRKTAENTAKLHDINEGIGKVEKAITSGSNATRATGIKVN